MAWDRLRPLLLRTGVPSNLFEPIRAVLDATSGEQRTILVRQLVPALTVDGHAARLLRALAAGGQDARRLGLELVAVLPAPLDPAIIQRLRPLLRDRRLPAPARLAATEALTRSTADNHAATMRILRDFAAGIGKYRALERIPALRRHFGHLPEFRPFLAYLRRKVKLRCPHCKEKLRHDAMVRHLWQQHGALLVGRRTTTQWRLIDTWGGADPTRGLVRLHRWMLRHGLSDAEAEEHLRHEAGQQWATLCPECLGLVPLPADRFPKPEAARPLWASHGRLAASGYEVAVTERGLFPHLSVVTPRGIVFSGREPGGQLGDRALRWLGVGPWLVLALVLAVVTPSRIALLATTIALTAAFAVRCIIRVARRPATDPSERAIGHAWTILVPRLHTDGFDDYDAAFLTRLALTSAGRGAATSRAPALKRLLDESSRALQSGRGRPADHAALVRLAVADAAVVGADPVVLLAETVQHCFNGTVPLGLAELVLTEEMLLGWTVGQRARLRVLLAARAFEAGLEVADLHDLGRAASSLGRALASSDTDGLARLRLLWTLRPSRPWQVCGPAATVFELANYPMIGGQHLETAPDLLLFQPLSMSGEPGPPSPLLICGRGLLYRNVLLHNCDTPVDVREDHGVFELAIGGNRIPFRGDPGELARRLRRWSAYYFKEFQPQMDAILLGPSLKARQLIEELMVTCPECGTALLGRGGDKGERW